MTEMMIMIKLMEMEMAVWINEFLNTYKAAVTTICLPTFSFYWTDVLPVVEPTVTTPVYNLYI